MVEEHLELLHEDAERDEGSNLHLFQWCRGDIPLVQVTSKFLGPLAENEVGVLRILRPAALFGDRYPVQDICAVDEAPAL